MLAMTPPSPAVLRAYTMSRYVAGDVVARIGSPTKGLHPNQARTSLVFLGACNPYGRKRPGGWNTRMMRRLRSILRRIRFIEATGSLGQWSEAMLMAPMDPRRAAVVARRFQQNAIVVVLGKRTQLIILKS